MTTLREAATQALEACEQRLPLKGQAAIIDELNNLRAALVEDAMQKFTDVNQELEAALAEPVQEPVAWVYTGIKQDGTEHGPHLVWKPAYMDAMSASKGAQATPLYTAPPQRPAEPVQEPQCNPHPKAPHGFLRNASHTEDRYVCECEGWEPYEAGYQAGIEAALREQS